MGVHHHGGGTEAGIEVAGVLIALGHILLGFAAGQSTFLHERGMEGGGDVPKDLHLPLQLLVKAGGGPAGGEFHADGKVLEGADTALDPVVVLEQDAVIG